MLRMSVFGDGSESNIIAGVGRGPSTMCSSLVLYRRSSRLWACRPPSLCGSVPDTAIKRLLDMDRIGRSGVIDNGEKAEASVGRSDSIPTISLAGVRFVR